MHITIIFVIDISYDYTGIYFELKVTKLKERVFIIYRPN